jgi:multiple antibiotic resistance protein
MAIRGGADRGGILLFFGLLGEDLLEALGVSLAAFRIAGGIMLFLIALEMVFERAPSGARTARRRSTPRPSMRTSRSSRWRSR